MKTREKIKQAAIDMFNEKGASNVSTVQLSERLKISPGNLYYYFDNKEHLIRDIWNEDIITSVDMLFYREDFGHSENGILNFFNDYSRAVFKFRFYYAETFVLLKNDPVMMDLYQARAEKLHAQLIKVMGSWEETEIIHEITDGEKKLLTDNLWIISQIWPNYASVLQDFNDDDDILKDSVIHAYSLLSPYFTDSAKERMIVLMKKKGIADNIDFGDFDNK